MIWFNFKVVVVVNFFIDVFVKNCCRNLEVNIVIFYELNKEEIKLFLGN